MDRDTALQHAIELAKITIENTKDISPVESHAACIADFIETLTNRLFEIGNN